MVSKRNAKSTNPLCTDYDSSKPTAYDAYYGANNLYGYAINKPLPVPVPNGQWQNILTQIIKQVR